MGIFKFQIRSFIEEDFAITSSFAHKSIAIEALCIALLHSQGNQKHSRDLCTHSCSRLIYHETLPTQRA